MDERNAKIFDSIIRDIRACTESQLDWIGRIINTFSSPCEFRLVYPDLISSRCLDEIGDALRIHHTFSAEPFTKDKFEYTLVRSMKRAGMDAVKAPRGTRGYDMTVDGIRLSLKTQADRNISRERVWISKFMELGSGQWSDDPSDLVGLRNQFLRNLDHYGRILSLRALTQTPKWEYELIEIPKQLLMLAKNGRLHMKSDSRQSPKPGYCYVDDTSGTEMFKLYFDGGGERKLQIKDIRKELCLIHATWTFITPPESALPAPT